MDTQNSDQARKFVVQNDARSHQDNLVLFWGQGGEGYTPDIEKAHLFTKAEALELAGEQSTNLPHHVDTIRKAQISVLDRDALAAMQRQISTLDEPSSTQPAVSNSHIRGMAEHLANNPNGNWSLDPNTVETLLKAMFAPLPTITSTNDAETAVTERKQLQIAIMQAVDISGLSHLRDPKKHGLMDSQKLADAVIGLGKSAQSARVNSIEALNGQLTEVIRERDILKMSIRDAGSKTGLIKEDAKLNTHELTKLAENLGKRPVVLPGAALEAIRQRDMLGKAIFDAATHAGMCTPDAQLTGPQLMTLADDLGAAASETVTRNVADINAKAQATNDNHDVDDDSDDVPGMR